MSLPRLFIARPVPEQALRVLDGKVELDLGPNQAVLDRAELLARVREADAMVSMLGDRIDAEVLDAAPRLKVVAAYSVGFNNIDVQAAEDRGIWVTNTPDAVTDSTAELAIGLMIAAARRMGEGERWLREGHFQGWFPMHFMGMQLAGATLGLIGLGRIGQATAARARALGMRLVYSQRHRLPESEETRIGAAFRSFDALLAESDVVSVHCPLDEGTRHLVDARALARMKPTAVLVNTARGPIVDEAALARALHDRKLGGAGLDVFEDEPRVHPDLLAAPNAVLVPHLGTSALATRMAMAELALANVLAVLSGERPRNPVNRPAHPRL